MHGQIYLPLDILSLVITTYCRVVIITILSVVVITWKGLLNLPFELVIITYCGAMVKLPPWNSVNKHFVVHVYKQQQQQHVATYI